MTFMIRLTHQPTEAVTAIPDDLPKGPRTDGDHDRSTGVLDFLSSHKTIGTVHSNGSNGVLTQMLSDFKHQSTTFGFGLTLSELHFERIQDRGKVLGLEVDVDDGSNDRFDRANLQVRWRGVRASADGDYDINHLEVLSMVDKTTHPVWQGGKAD